ncbi:MAG: 4-hydroxy-3-methylbut-2-enyl diphosphate reductase [Syntrophobacterales bacterium]|nr:4-hydroxy-3-methylbut-2-enyl diphosphate reductase [Syntrophobacterales bacterium]
MGIKLAKTAGFCMGVKRAVEMVLEMASQQEHVAIYTYGPLIHNPQTIELLRERGIIPLRRPEELETVPEGASVVIRAHGIPPRERKKLEDKGFKIIDATCPKVTRVQMIIRKHASMGFTVLIAGDREHPEVNGLLGFAGDAGVIIGSPADVAALPAFDKVCVVAQTTQSRNVYSEIVEKVTARFPEAVIFNTICDSTEKRQTEIETLAAESDAVFVVGGKNSANTRRLTELAILKNKPAFHIETAAELQGIDLEPYRQIGVSAGASTPNWIIDRVVDHLNSRMGKREELLHRLFKLWVFAVRADIYSAIGAGFLSFTAMLLQGLPIAPLPIFTASLYVYSMHVLNRFINRKTSSISSFREESYLIHEQRYLTLAACAISVALFLAFTAGKKSFLVLFTISLLGILYNMRFLPFGFRFKSLRDIPGSKNISTAFAWAIAAALLPRLENGSLLHAGLWVSFIFTAGIVFIRSGMSDILDIQRDRLIGQETLPVLLGEKKTLVILKTICLFLFVLLPLSAVVGWSATLGFFQLIAIFYMWICFKLYDRRSAFSGVVLEGFLESGYFVVGISSLLWLLATGALTR